MNIDSAIADAIDSAFTAIEKVAAEMRRPDEMLPSARQEVHELLTDLLQRRGAPTVMVAAAILVETAAEALTLLAEAAGRPVEEIAGALRRQVEEQFRLVQAIKDHGCGSVAPG